ncbi:MAG: caspase family protein, partial [Caldilineaceae bacterium]|nr:caspase family protein [Caldilineaceae bacterium]
MAAANAPQMYALLIGVDHYLPNTLPGGVSYAPLGGCVEDVGRVEEFLRTKLNVPEANIQKLTATSSPDGRNIVEPFAAWPTYDNMVAAFQRLSDNATAGDEIYIHYSGHGGRANTIYANLKGANALDEGLVPTDIGNSEARYLRDLEIAHILKGMVDKGLVVTAVFDSCHSGGMSLEAEARTPPMEMTLVQRIVAQMTSLIPCGMLLSPTDRVVCEGNVKNVHLDHDRIDLDPGPNFTT